MAQVTPTCGVGNVVAGLEQATYNTIGFTGSPGNSAAFQNLVNNFAIPSLNFGSAPSANINGIGNPFGSDENYLTIFTGYISIPADGTYTFAVDGDDAVEVLINGVSVSGFFGLHASAGSGQNPGSVFLAAGLHDITFRHHEFTGQDSYTLFWQQPGDSGLSIAPSSVFRHCPSTPITLLPDITPPCTATLSGLSITTYDKTGFGHPNSTGEFATQIAAVATAANQFGTGSVNNINTPANGNNNPFGSGSNYLTIISGLINVPTDGIYFFAVDGDDAVEVIIDGNVVSGFYGGHGRNNVPTNAGSIGLEAGYHTIEFHHEEVGGGDNYHLYWLPPSASSFQIVPNSVLEFCNTIPLNPDITPPCLSPASGLFLSTYDQTGNGAHPNNTTEFANLINTFAIPANLFGSGIVSNIDTTGSNNNPFQANPDERYISIFEGLLFAPTDGFYQIGVDGDDAVEVLIDGNVITGFYGGHGRSGTSVNPVSIGLEAGYHLVEFHHEEIGGGDNYGLYWQEPGSTTSVIIPNSNLFNCPIVATLNVNKAVDVLYDPVNCATNPCGIGDNPKAIQGSISTYTIDITNNGLGTTTNDTVVIDDDLPDNVALFVGNLNGSGLPIRVFDGNSTSPDGTGCTNNCSNLTITAADISYSNNNGATYTYTPSPDADGYDSNITNIRVSPSGIFATDVLSPPILRLELQTRLDN